MLPDQKLLEMLSNSHPQVRLMALEQLRICEPTSPDIFQALEKATHDQDKAVAYRANQVFHLDVYHQMAISMGVLTPDIVVDAEKFQSSPDPSQTSPTEPLEPPNEHLQWWNTPYIPPFEEAHEGLRLGQLITFTLSLFALIMYLEHPMDYFQHGIWPLIYLIMVPIFIGLQIYSINKYGLRKSFSFLKDFFKSFVNNRSR